MGYATEYWHFLVIGLFVGLAGGSFSVGTPYVARWFPKNRQGTGHGRVWRGQLGRGRQQVCCAGHPGGLWLDHGAPGVRRHHAGHAWCCSGCSATATLPTSCPATSSSPTSSKRSRTQACSSTASTTRIVFGGYVALSLWMVQYYVGEYGLDIRVAALLAACFSLPGGVLRAIGGMFCLTSTAPTA